jgi:tetratricopeptide (TPR) repeat protein
VFNDLLDRAPNDKQRVTYYFNIVGVYSKMGEYPKALSHYERALRIRKLALGDVHPDTKSVAKNIELVKKKLQFVDQCAIVFE